MERNLFGFFSVKGKILNHHKPPSSSLAYPSLTAQKKPSAVPLLSYTKEGAVKTHHDDKFSDLILILPLSLALIW